VLLIVAALTPAALRRLLTTATGVGLAALVEVHDREELSQALDAGATLVGVNSRNLRTLHVNRGLFEVIASSIPRHVVTVAESGLSSAEDLARLHELRYDAFLVGERLLSADDPRRALALLLEGSGGERQD
jgi:indole-3-glycerol phosphate synthase